MLGEGLRAGLAHLGLAHRTVCYLEREAYAAATLAARCLEGSLDDPPVWSDLLTFDASAWHGAVDCIAAGFPCQDLSLAGRRAGLDGQRSGLFFDILDIADRCGAWCLFLENVAGIASATASTVDEESASEYVGNYHAKGFSQVGVEDGRLLERAAARVVGELADRGWHAEWLTLSASDVGASHGRERWFCFAWRMADTERQPVDAEHATDMQRGWAGETEQTGLGSGAMGHPHQQRQQQPHHTNGPQPRPDPWAGAGGSGSELGHPEGQRRREARPGDPPPDHARPGGPGAELADPTGHRRNEGWPQPAGQQGRPDAPQRSQPVADASSPRCQGSQLGRTLHGHRGGAQAHGPAEQLCRPLFAPSPTHPDWPHIIAQWPERAPALEPDFHGMADGMAYAMDESRAQRLKCCGNGVVALCAATAFVVLARRSGLTRAAVATSSSKQ